MVLGVAAAARAAAGNRWLHIRVHLDGNDNPESW
jgi:hypothetical protein